MGILGHDSGFDVLILHIFFYRPHNLGIYTFCSIVDATSDEFLK